MYSYLALFMYTHILLKLLFSIRSGAGVVPVIHKHLFELLSDVSRQCANRKPRGNSSMVV